MRVLKPGTKLPVYPMYPRFLLELNTNDTAKMVYLLRYLPGSFFVTKK